MRSLAENYTGLPPAQDAPTTDQAAAVAAHRPAEATYLAALDAAGIAYLGRADIGHDAGNRVVPFGRT